MDKKDYDKWFSCEIEKQCNGCDFKGDISQIDKINCSKRCGYTSFECDDCGSNNTLNKTNKTNINNQIIRIDFTSYTKYLLLLNPQEEWSIWICNNCKKNDDEKKIIENIDTLLGAHKNRGEYAVSYDIIGNQIYPQLKENDFQSILKKIFAQ